jgi:hypothetical protein
LYQDSLCIRALLELQFEASFPALDRDQAQQRCELLLVLGGNTSHGQERGAVAVRPRSFAVEPKRTLNGAQVGVERSAFAIEAQPVIAQRRVSSQ